MHIIREMRKCFYIAMSDNEQVSASYADYARKYNNVVTYSTCYEGVSYKNKKNSIAQHA